MKRAVSVAVFALAICASCAAVPAGSDTQSTPSSPSSAPASESSGPSTTTQPTTPAELQGSWHATLSTGEEVTLDLSPYGYTVHGVDIVSGNIDITGDQAVFRSPVCDLGAGIYRWSIEGETLVFTPLEPRDPCAGRIGFLEGATYTRTE